MNKGPDSGAASDHRELTLPDHLNDVTVRRNRRTRPVEATVTQNDPRDSRRIDDHLFEFSNCLEAFRHGLRRIRIERIVLSLDAAPLAGVGPSRVALD